MRHTSVQKTKLRKVLIIEDEGDMCLLLNILLDGKEMEVDHVKSLAKAQEYLSETSPDVVLLDNKLPDGFGVEFVQYIKKNYPLVKVVMISGFDPSASDVAIENGADKFLTKPFTRDQLLQSIKGVLN